MLFPTFGVYNIIVSWGRCNRLIIAHEIASFVPELERSIWTNYWTRLWQDTCTRITLYFIVVLVDPNGSYKTPESDGQFYLIGIGRYIFVFSVLVLNQRNACLAKYITPIKYSEYFSLLFSFLILPLNLLFLTLKSHLTNHLETRINFNYKLLEK